MTRADALAYLVEVRVEYVQERNAFLEQRADKLFDRAQKKIDALSYAIDTLEGKDPTAARRRGCTVEEYLDASKGS